MPNTQPIAIILAAGKGTRMGGDLPKVLFEAAGKPLVRWVLDALAAAGVHDRLVVVGYRAELVESAGWDAGRVIRTAAGATRHGRRGGRGGRRDPRPARRRSARQPPARGDRLRRFADASAGERGRPARGVHHPRASCLLGTAITDDPAGLGRIVRDAHGRFTRIVEQKDATPEERGIREVNMSTYVFEARDLLRTLADLRPDNAAGEYYITDCPGMLLAAGKVVDAIPCLDASETLSVNTPEQLAAVATALSSR